MTYSTTFITKTLFAFVITCAVAASYTVPAAAQTASKLDCKGCVKSKQLKNGGIKGKDLKDQAVGNDKLSDNAVNGQKIADGAVGTADLASDAVTSSKIADDAVGSSEVQGDSILGTDIANEAGSDFDGANEREEITTTDETVRSVAISAPSSGQVIVVASGTWDSDVTVITGGRCSITTGTAVTTTAASEITLFNDPDEDLTPFALTRGFNVLPGTTTFNLVCDVTIANENAFILDAQMTAMFFPTVY